MDHFISVIFAKQLNESKRDIVLDTMINTARVGLTESSVEYELFESEDSSTVLRLPLAKPIKEAHQQAFVEALANKLFDKGHTNFEIELSVLNENLLRKGSRGADVKALQAQLGMPAAEQDGIFGPKTEQAVRNFQTSQGLQVDGIVGPQTRTAIANSEAAGVATRDAPYNPQEVPQTPTQRRTQQQAPQTAAPQTSPRPQARPAQGMPDESDPTQTAGGDPEITTRVLDKDGNAIEPMPVDDLANMANQAIDRAGTQGTTAAGTGDATSGATASGAQGDGLRGSAAAAAGPAQGTTVAGRPEVPVGSLPGSAGAGPAPGTGGQNPADAQPYTSRTVNNQTTAAIGQQADQTIDTTAGVDANVGEPGQQGGVDTLRQQRTDAQNKAADDKLVALAQQVKAAKTAAEREKAVTALRGAANAEVPTTDDPTTSSGDGFDVSRLKMAPKGPQVTTAAQANSIFQNPNATEEERKAAQMFYARQKIQNQQDRFNDSVEPRPKGAFMFRERNEWDEKYSRTHNKDGSLKAKTNLIESRKYDEVTYHDDDQFYEDYGVMWYNDDEVVDEAEYQGRKVKLGKPMKGDVKKFKVYVKNPKGNVVKVNFGQKGVKIKKSNPARRRSFRARHNCDNPGPRHKARYWSCRKW
jgi:peptidoglycan hydrolase-like protein with peptidoglycan-binding domain